MTPAPKYSPNSFFFTDPAAITQSAAQAFGPVSENQYRLTTKFSVGADTNAYAVCTGVVLVQPQTANSALVNVILRPFKQPITGLNIKYFIYRGLNISEFFDNGTVISADEGTSDFINKINASFTAYYTSTGATPPAFLAKFIGFDPANQPDGMMIADIFFKITQTTGTPPTETAQTAFELPVIAAGASLGTFATGECGFDIVLDYGDYVLPTPNDQFTFNLAYARKAESIIDLTNVEDDFLEKLLKEQIFQFLDAAAYYGFHYANGTVMVGGGTTPTKYTTDGIYNSVIQNFSTKNTFYLYIQSDRTRSYNFYGNYNITDTDHNCLNVGYAANALSESGYGTSGWPINIYTTTQATNDPNITFYIQFVTDNNDNKVFYGQVAQVLNAQGNNFSGPDDLQLPADSSGNIPDLTKIMQLSNPATGASGSKNYVATFNILIYQGAVYNYISGQITDGSGNTTNVTAQPAYFDDVFDLINSSPIFANNNSAYTVITSQKLKLVNHFYNGVQQGVSAIQTTIINDSIVTGNLTLPSLARVIYLSESIDMLNNLVSPSGSIPPDTKSLSAGGTSISNSVTFELPAPFFYDLQLFTDSSITITGIQLKVTDNFIPSKIILGIAKSENDLLRTLIPGNNFANPRLFLISISENQSTPISPEGVSYQKYKLVIVGEANDGTLKTAAPDSDVIIYSIDQKFHFSKVFSDNMPPYSGTLSDNLLLLDVRL